MYSSEKQKRMKSRLDQIVQHCHFFHGEASVPYQYTQKQRVCWQYEKEWAESLADSYTNRDKYVGYFKKRFNNRPLTFHRKVGMPKSLFAYFFIKCDSSCFVHEWIDMPFKLISGTYSNKSPQKLMADFLGVSSEQILI